MKRADHKSDCPINFTVEIFGDTWSMLIVRDMAALGKKTFGEFLASDERIGESVLAERLARLEEKGVIHKEVDGSDKRKTVYTFTEIGISAIPILYEIATWGSNVSPNPVSHPFWFKSMEYDRGMVVRYWQEALRKGSCFFLGPDSVIKKLGFE